MLKPAASFSLPSLAVLRNPSPVQLGGHGGGAEGGQATPRTPAGKHRLDTTSRGGGRREETSAERRPDAAEGEIKAELTPSKRG